MRRSVPVGLVLQPEASTLELCEDLLGEAAYLEIAPETTWRLDRDTLVPNGFWRLFAALVARTGQPVVAHGVGLSMTSTGRREAARRRRWYARLAEDQRTFGYRWYSDHLGAAVLADEVVGLPLPPPMDGATAARVRARLREMRAVCPDVGFENTAHPFVLGDPMEEPAFFQRCLADGGWLVLDLHNVYTMATNLGFDAADYVARLPLERVIEVHVSGGSESDPAWLPGGRVVRLDGHDGPVPEPVWALLERVLPACPAVRGVTLERMEGTLTEAEVPAFAAEVARLRDICAGGATVGHGRSA